MRYGDRCTAATKEQRIIRHDWSRTSLNRKSIFYRNVYVSIPRNASILVPQFRNLISLRAVRQCGWNMRSPRVSRVLDTWWVFFACYHQPPIDFPRSSHTKRKKKRRRKVETRKNISIIEYTQFRIVIKLKLNNKFLVTKLCKKDKSRNLSRFELSFFHRERRQPK